MALTAQKRIRMPNRRSLSGRSCGSSRLADSCHTRIAARGDRMTAEKCEGLFLGGGGGGDGGRDHGVC